MTSSGLAALAAVSLLAAAQAGQVPTVKSGVEVIAVDVEVVGRDGEPIAGLRPADFEVRLDGRPRRVVSADFIRYGTTGAAAAPVVTPGATPPAARRLYLIAVDEHSFRQGSAMAAMKAASGFIDKLRPDDLVGLHAYPTGTAHVDFTTDHALVKSALGKIVGLFDPPRSEFHMSLSEIIDINASDGQVFAKVVARECPPGDMFCPEEVRSEALMLASFLEMQIAQSLGGLRGLIEGLAAVPERKTVVLVSGGLMANDRVGGRPDASGLTMAVGREALRANVNLYVLHMDTSFQDAFSSGQSPRLDTLFRDSSVSAQGLEMVAGAGGGAVMRVQAGTLDSSFARVLKETSAHYVLGVAVEEADRNGKAHGISVRYKKRGATLRSRSLVLIPRPGAAVADPEPEPSDEMPAEPPQPPLAKPGAKTPPLEAILRSAAMYLDAYEKQASAIVSEETYLQQAPQPGPQTPAVSRELRSDMLIVPEARVGWIGFRDVFEVDGTPVHNRTERLTNLFLHPLPDTMAQARRIVVEGSRLNLRSDIHRTINTPMMALRFLRFVDQRRSKFTLDGLQEVDGVSAAVVRFEEKLKPRMIESDDDAAAKGTFWIEPGTGRVLKTELLFDTGEKSTRLRVRVRVGYAAYPALETWVPVTMDEEYRLGKGALAVEGHATYANFRKFRVETNINIKDRIPVP
ncbi:MAG: hypothetical protein A3H96_07160 [Acidobacteria bacterium RIFCSPLOWO2_02_FULL_67_36]|nr:MAG: hypothetical protein A3H96_07160 [Acidobacteria bacterium RIFCSPLOWO2_02_FULL_67_36]OFW26497.1 MAG: hypothetical protein A3G21_24165 [Acidobacteria bacterium RIFCSPLOWO2_12_FULL_66_21]